MKRICTALTLGALALFAGCAQQAMVRNAPAPARKSEITIQHSAKKAVTDALVSEMVSRDFTIKNESDYIIVFAKPLENNAGRRQYAKRGASGSLREQRLSCTIVESGGGVRVVLTEQVVTNPGSASERISEEATGQDWQGFLTSFANLFRGRVGIAVDRYGMVTDVTPASPATTAGMQKGDKLLRVDGAPYTGPDQLIGDPDTKVVVVVLRQGKEVPMLIYRKVVAGPVQPATPPSAPTPAPAPAAVQRRK